MQFRGSKVSKNLSNYVVTISDIEMEKWGREFGYAIEEVFSVDTHVGETHYETFVGVGYHGTPTSKKFGVTYFTTVVYQKNPLTDNFAWLVKFNLASKLVNGVRQYYEGTKVPTHYEYFVSRRSYFRDAFDKFLRDVIKDGHLAFFNKGDENAAAEEGQINA